MGKKHIYPTSEDPSSCSSLYDDYLQSLARKILTQQSLQQQTEQIVCELATVALQQDQLRQEFIKIKLDENQIINLMKIQKEITNELNQWIEYNNSNNLEIVKKITSNMYHLLQPFDTLQYENIELPCTKEEWQSFVNQMHKLLNALELNKKLIGQKSKSFEKTAHNVIEFTEMGKKLHNVQQKFTDTLSKLQQIVLCDSAKILDEGEQKSNKYKEN